MHVCVCVLGERGEGKGRGSGLWVSVEKGRGSWFSCSVNHVDEKMRHVIIPELLYYYNS